MKTIRILAITNAITFILLVVFAVAALVGWLGVFELQEHVMYHCADFSSQESAQIAYTNGATYLDGGHGNGKACDSFKY